LNADDGAANRRLHGVGSDGTFAFSGEECRPWYGHLEGGSYTVAGNLLTGESVIEETTAAYEAGNCEELPVHSGAVLVRTTEERELEPFTEDLRVDATETPIADRRETHELAMRRSFEDAMERYEDAYEEDDIGSVDEAGGDTAGAGGEGEEAGQAEEGSDG